VWSQDGNAFYYVGSIATIVPSASHRHRLGTSPADDTQVVAAEDSGLFVSLSKLQSGRFAEVSLHDHETSESWLIDLAEGDAKPVLVAPREASIRYGVEHHPDAGGAPGLLIVPNAGDE
jgi:oligopeptidase B